MATKLQIGEKYSRLTVVSWDSIKKAWLCDCDCGNTTFARSYSLKTGKHKSCGCLNKEPRPHRRLPNNLAMKKSLYKNYKSSAQRRGYNFTLSLEEFVTLIEEDCYYCGETPKNSTNSQNIKNYGNYKYNGIDRENNSLGYSINNVVPCCETCNIAKRQLSINDFKNWIEKVYKKMFND